MKTYMELTLKRNREFVHIVLQTDEEIIRYAKKYIKQGWQVYSICNDKYVEVKCKTF